MVDISSNSAEGNDSPARQSIMDIGNDVFIPWYTEVERDWYEFDGGCKFDVPKTAIICHDVIRNRTSFTRVFRSTASYSAHLSHSVRADGTYTFLFRIITVANSVYFPGDSREVSIGIENSISDPLFWQLTSGNKHGRLPEKSSKELQVLMRHLCHFLRLLSWVNSILNESKKRISEASILYITKIRFIMQHSNEKAFGLILESLDAGWVVKNANSRLIDCELKAFTANNSYRNQRKQIK